MLTSEINLQRPLFIFKIERSGIYKCVMILSYKKTLMETHIVNNKTDVFYYVDTFYTEFLG